MERLNYAGESILTGSALAKAVLEYAEALAKADTSANIEIPTREPDGSIGVARLLIGPASQLITVEEKSGLPEVEDAALVAEFKAKTRALGPVRADAIGSLELDDYTDLDI
jgi:hypothetical protein